MQPDGGGGSDLPDPGAAGAPEPGEGLQVSLVAPTVMVPPDAVALAEVTVPL